MAIITVTQDIQYSIAGAGGSVGQQPYKKKIKVDTLSNWKLTETLNGLREFEFTVKNDELEKSNILVERNISVPLLTPFNGIITEKSPEKSHVKFKAVEDAWHFKRRHFKCHDKSRIKYTDDEWYDRLWLMRREITIPERFTAKITNDIINYPLLYHVIDPELKAHARGDGFDILFTQIDTDGTIIKLKHTISNYTRSTGELFAWIEFPEIKSGSIKFRMYFNNPDATDQQSTTTFDNYGFGGVWHLNELATPVLDATSNNNDGTVTGAVTASGILDNSFEFDGVDDKIDCGSGATIDNIWRGSTYERGSYVANLSDISGLVAAGAKIFYSKIENLTPGDTITDVAVDITTNSGTIRAKLYDQTDGIITNLLAESGAFTPGGTGIQNIPVPATVVPENGIIWTGIMVSSDTMSLRGNGGPGGSGPLGIAASETQTYGTGPDPAGIIDFDIFNQIWTKLIITPKEGDGSSGGWASAWIKPRSDGELNSGEIMRKNNWGFRTIAQVGQTSRLEFFHTATGTDGTWRSATATDIVMNKWQKVDVVFNKSSIENDPSIYINGELNVSTENTAPTLVFDTDATSSLIIGNTSGGTETFDGFIDECRLHANPPQNVGELIKLSYKNESDSSFFFSGQVENYLEQADIIAQSIINSANMDMPVVDETPIPGLISLHRLNNDALDSSGFGHDGTWINSEKYGKGFFPNTKSMEGDGSRYIELSNTDETHDFDFSVPFTCAYKYKGTSAGAFIHIAKTDVIFQGLGWCVGSKSANQKIRWTMEVGVVGIDVEGDTLAPPVNDGKWHTIIWSYDGSTFASGVTCYYDGKIYPLKVNNDNQSGSASNSYDVRIGSTEGGSSILNSDSFIDDVRFYDRALTTEEAKKLYMMTQSDINPVRQMVQWKLGDGHSTNIPNLIHLWKFDQSLIDSKGNNELVVVGEEQYDDGFYSGKGFKFDASTYIDMIDKDANTDFERTNEFSVAVKVKFTGAPGVTNNTIIADMINATPFQGWDLIKAPSGLIELQLLNNNSPANWLELKSVASIEDNEWHTIVFSYGGLSSPTSTHLYLDGIEDNTNPQDSLNATILNTNGLTIGSRFAGVLPWEGMIDDLRIYDRALTSLEAKRIFEATDSPIDDYRDDSVPTRSLEINFEHKNHYESFKKVAKALGKDLYFDSRAHRVYIRQKGKTVKEKFDKMQLTKPKFNLNNVANIVTVVGADEEDGGQKEKTFSDSNTLKYDYETTVANKQIATNATVDLVGNEVLTSIKDLTPDLSIETTPDQFNRFDLGVGDTISVNEIDQDLKGKFRIIKIETTEHTVKLSLSKETNQTIQTSGKDLGSIIGNLINAVQDLNVTPE